MVRRPRPGGGPWPRPEALVASVLKVREQPARSLTETLCLELADQSLLILLDNCEHLIDACAKLADALDTPALVCMSWRPPGNRSAFTANVSTGSPPCRYRQPTRNVLRTSSHPKEPRCSVERARAHHEGFVLDAAQLRRRGVDL